MGHTLVQQEETAQTTSGDDGNMTIPINVNATLPPIPVCPQDCNGRGVCIAIPSPSPTPSFVLRYPPSFDDPDVARALSEDPIEAARKRAIEQITAEAEKIKNSASSSPQAAPLFLPPGVSPSPTPLPGQIGGPVTDDMILGAAPGTPGGPSLPWQRRLVVGMCVCNVSFFGPLCEFEYCYPSMQCMGRGICRNTSEPYNATDSPPMYCVCEDGWKGENCQYQDHRCGILEGANAGYGRNCSGHGNCFDGVCVCHDLWTGDFCETPVCPLDCSGHGHCDNGVCECDEPFFGQACALAYCAENCSGHGQCNRYNGECICDDRWSGDLCDKKSCLNKCSERGTCNATTGICSCTSRWEGEDCSIPRCPSNCHGGHKCINHTCFCDPGWMGITCNTSVCWHGCRNYSHAICDPIYGTCSCIDGFIGNRCEIDYRCPKWVDPETDTVYQCNNHGKCVNARCACFPEYYGEDCSKQYFNCSAAFDCENGGVCEDGICSCPPEFKGIDCTTTKEKMCEHSSDCVHGTCVEGFCVCADGWGGSWCEKHGNFHIFDTDQITHSPSPTKSHSLINSNQNELLSRTNSSSKFRNLSRTNTSSSGLNHHNLTINTSSGCIEQQNFNSFITIVFFCSFIVKFLSN
eukprot:c18082_g2_i2.p1 GENE.c18082_g2_i2~~c18082_g2_i2.p1  ORF type:complete len:670 (+),score=319.48 c18082_g2_i2:113-2011(+)